jgi:Protein of unknown function (DUF3179)
VYSREIDGRVLTLAPSGWTYQRTFVLYDKETGSLWFPDDDGLLGIQGEYFMKRLPKVLFEDTVWRKWLRKNPESKILK